MIESFNAIANQLQQQVDICTPLDWYEDSLRSDATSYISGIRASAGSGEFRRACDYIESAAKRLEQMAFRRPRAIEDMEAISEAKQFAAQFMTDHNARILDLLEKSDPKSFVKAYSGKPGCCCGCRGNYTENPSTIKATRTKMIAAMRDGKADDAFDLHGGRGFSVSTSTRIYTIFFTR